MTLNLHSSGQQLTLENITTSESQSQQTQPLETPGLTLTDPSRLGDIGEYVVITEALKRGAEVYKNVGCTGKTDIVLCRADEVLQIDVKIEKWKADQGQFCSRGVCGATNPRVLVNPSTWTVRWPKGKAPQGWEDFWT